MITHRAATLVVAFAPPETAADSDREEQVRNKNNQPETGDDLAGRIDSVNPLVANVEHAVAQRHRVVVLRPHVLADHVRCVGNSRSVALHEMMRSERALRNQSKPLAVTAAQEVGSLKQDALYAPWACCKCRPGSKSIVGPAPLLHDRSRWPTKRGMRPCRSRAFSRGWPKCVLRLNQVSCCRDCSPQGLPRD